MNKPIELKSIDKVFADAANDKYDNHIYPFFWLRENETDKIAENLKAVYDCGIKGICVEGRPYEAFAEDKWWVDVEFILERCAEYGMKVWILDDKKFPTGYAADYIVKHGREGEKLCVFSHFTDVVGPVKDGAVLIKYYKIDPTDEILGIYACKREPNSNLLTGEVTDITGGIDGDFVYFDLPEGGYRISVVIKTAAGYSDENKQRIDFISPEAAKLMVKAVYQPHYEKFKKYFGNTLEGFFSDEPNLGNRGYLHKFKVEFGEYYAYYPWSDELQNILQAEVGDNALSMLPFLWNGSTKGVEAEIRTAYMDAVTRLYEKHFSRALGDWCREHGVLYTGHVIEDNGIHTQTGKGTGHYFRAMAGQDIPGVDVVLHQIMPGHAQYPTTGEVSYWICDNEFFHYTLAKLASSCAHITPRSHGRAMCEVFGAYGWAEGIRTMKWLTNFMLVRGINTFVPHAFSMQFPDTDCPPHFYACGNNPEFDDFKMLMRYMNRMSDILGNTTHSTQIAVMYHAEAQWSGGDYMPTDCVAKKLYDNQVDFDIVPFDSLAAAVVGSRYAGAFVRIGNAEYRCIAVPYSECLPLSAVEKLYELSMSGIMVVYVNGYPRRTSDGAGAEKYIAENGMMSTVDISDLTDYVWDNGLHDLRCIGKYGADSKTAEMLLRVYHGKNGASDLYMLSNEDKFRDINTVVGLNGFDGGEYFVYDCDLNRMSKGFSGDGRITVNISRYQSIIIVVGGNIIADECTGNYICTCETELTGNKFAFSLSTASEYPKFTKHCELTELKNVTGRDMFPNFSGYMKYETVFDIEPKGETVYKLDLGEVGESARVFVNGECVGERISQPYVFDITSAVRNGKNTLEITAANHLGYSQKDRFSRFMLFEPSGVLGPVKIKAYKRS